MGWKRHFWVSSIPPPFLVWCRGSCTLPHSEGVCVNAQWPHSSLLPSVSSQFSGDCIQRDQPAATGTGTGNLFYAQIPLSSMTKASAFPSSLPQPSAHSIPSLSPLGTANVPTYIKERAWLMCWGRQKENPRFGAGPGSDHVFFTKEIWCLSALHPTESLSCLL